MHKYAVVRRLRENWATMTTIVLLCLFVLLFQPGTTSISVLTASHQLASTNEEGKLLLVQAVFRHGARTPLNTIFWGSTAYSNCSLQYPGPELVLRDERGAADPPAILDLDSPKLPGGCRMGQLTYTGHNMAVDLGTWLRQRYIERQPFLPPVFSSGQMSLRTTCIDRAMKTLQGVLQGMYPSLQGPVAVNASQEKYEFEYGKQVTCAAIEPLLEEIRSLLATRDAASTELKRLAGLVRSALGLPPGNELDWVHLRDSLATMQAEGLPPPTGLDPDIQKVINEQAVFHEAAVVGPIPEHKLLDAAGCRRVIKMAIGPLVWRIAHNLQAAAALAQSGEAAVHAPLMYMYSGHDSTITPLLVVLGQPETQWPPFTASLVFELMARPSRAAAAAALKRGREFRALGRSGLRGEGMQLDVRVLYDREVMRLRGSGPGGWLDLQLFTKMLLQPYSYSDEEKQDACSHVPS